MELALGVSQSQFDPPLDGGSSEIATTTTSGPSAMTTGAPTTSHAPMEQLPQSQDEEPQSSPESPQSGDESNL